MKRVDAGTSGGPVEESKRPLVLYVEDELENWEVAELRLKRRFELVWAKSADEAFELVRARGAELAAVLMDIQLKGSSLDGVDVTRVLKGQAPERPAPPSAAGLAKVVAPLFFVTAFGSLYDEAMLRAAGGEGVLSKPVDFFKLNGLLAQATTRRVLQTLQGG